eukprot:CAMPEP_0119217380 /NCGR_PEP_ID=MMETSP1327-20130426/17890_1 /TAXON_ID=38833 /ORGANISM="Micromonas pusilla, Strain RCC2306" /LENGTH=146 /DNA_ID=CAMNT_0007215337 /DNA_START=84 /DNA_END=524 /DNA_ORIENTATION=+
MSPPADGAAATSAQIAASRTAGSRSSSVVTATGTTSLTPRFRSPLAISPASSRNARSTIRRVSSRTLQFLCRHAGDSFPTSSCAPTTEDRISAMNKSRPESRTGPFASPKRSKAAGSNGCTSDAVKQSGAPRTATANAAKAPAHTL